MNPETVVEQGSPEWHRLRARKITASEMGCVLAKPTTKRHGTYFMQKFRAFSYGELPDDSPKPWHQHGLKYEKFARSMCSLFLNSDIRECGIFVNPAADFMSASPDGVIENQNSGIEIKCRSSLSAHEKTKYAGKCPPEYMPQVQTQIICGGFDHVWFASFYVNPDDPDDNDLFLVKVNPDEKYIEKIYAASFDFWAKLQTKLENGK